jgi:general secretion pathway protein K
VQRPCVEYRVTDEGAKIPINFPESAHDAKLYPLLVHVLSNMGVELEDATGIADSIIDWQDKDSEHRVNGAEDDYYSGLPNPYDAKDARLDSIEELLLIKGVTPELYYGGTEEFPVGLRDVFTIFNDTGEVNLRFSTPEMKRILFGLDDEELAQIEQQVSEQQGVLLPVLEARLPIELQGGNLVSETDENGAILTVEAQAQLPNSRVKAHVGAVIDIDDSNEGIVVFRWMDQMAVEDTSS